MAKYKIEIKNSAKKQLHNLPKNVVQKTLAQIEELAADPRPTGYQKLVGRETIYSV